MCETVGIYRELVDVMAKFDLQQTVAVAAINQLIGEWTQEIDANHGLSIAQANVLTTDCRCKLLDQRIEGRDNITKFYNETYAQAKAGEGVAVVRQLVTNLRVSFISEAEAKVGFKLLLFAKLGKVPFSDYCEPVEVADVSADCRRDADGDWRISMLEGTRIFRRD